MPRDIDWRSYLNRLTYCYGCGRFGVPRKGRPPMGWRMLYQPHHEGPGGLQVCSEKCADEVREAMKQGPVMEPIKLGQLPVMDVELRHQMNQELEQEAKKQVDQETRFVFPCDGCGVRLNPVTSNGIPRVFSCPQCGADYVARFAGPGDVAFDRVTVTKKSGEAEDGDSVPRPPESDPPTRSPEG